MHLPSPGEQARWPRQVYSWEVRTQAAGPGPWPHPDSVTRSQESPRSPWESGDLELPWFPVCEMGMAGPSASLTLCRLRPFLRPRR